MTTSAQDRFGELRSLLQQETTSTSWSQLTRLLETWEDEELEDRILTYARNATESWSDDLCVTPQGWVTRLSQGELVPELSLARTLKTSTNADALLNALLESDLPIRLRALLLDGVLTDTGARALATWPGLRDIHTLQARLCQNLSAPSLDALLSSPHLHSLTHLDLSHTATTHEHVEALARASSLSDLTHLELLGLTVPDHAARALAHGLPRPRLTHLAIGANAQGRYTHDDASLGWPAVRAVLAWAEWRLTSLLLHNNIWVFSETAGWRVEHLPQLERLQMFKCSLHATLLESLLEGDLPPTLGHLDLGHNNLGPQGAQVLADLDLSQLERLDLFRARLGPEGLHALLQAPWFRGLSQVDLSMNDLPGDALRPLRDHDDLGWRTLTLSANDLGDGVYYLSREPVGLHLEHLTLSSCKITPQGARALGSAHTLKRLRGLNLYANPLGPDGARALLSSDAMPALEDLDLRDTGADDDAATALANNPAFANLRHLRLSHNAITDRGAQALAQAPHLGHLQTLDLSDNPIGDEGRSALHHAPHLPWDLRYKWRPFQPESGP